MIQFFTSHSPVELALYYIAGGILWAFVMGLSGDAGVVKSVLLKFAIWPVSAAFTVGSVLRRFFA